MIINCLLRPPFNWHLKSWAIQHPSRSSLVELGSISGRSYHFTEYQYGVPVASYQDEQQSHSFDLIEHPRHLSSFPHAVHYFLQ